jgi:hypothetical protein
LAKREFGERAEGKGREKRTRKSGKEEMMSTLAPSGDDISSGENKSRSAPVVEETVGMLVKHLTLRP